MNGMGIIGGADIAGIDGIIDAMEVILSTAMSIKNRVDSQRYFVAIVDMVEQALQDAGALHDSPERKQYFNRLRESFDAKRNASEKIMAAIKELKEAELVRTMDFPLIKKDNIIM